MQLHHPKPMIMASSNSWVRKGRLMLLPIGVFIFIGLLSIFQPTRDSVYGSYWSKYPYQESYQKYSYQSNEYNIAVISDMDVDSRIGDKLQWKGILKMGTLIRDPETGKYSVTWKEDIRLVTKYNEEGRGMELSELAFFNGRLLSCDDRTGILYELLPSSGLAIPRHIAVEGDGNTSAKGLKCEWMTVKEDALWMGSVGKEWVVNGEVKSTNNLWVKRLTPDGNLKHIDWTSEYTRLREFTSTMYPGYITHEAITWIPSQRKWVILPRRISTQPYDEGEDESRGSNRGFIVSENFDKIKEITIGENNPTHGFSSVKFVPFRENEIVALKTVEYKGSTSSYILVANLDTGELLMPETKFSDSIKFEGLEFV